MLAMFERDDVCSLHIPNDNARGENSNTFTWNWAFVDTGAQNQSSAFLKPGHTAVSLVKSSSCSEAITFIVLASTSKIHWDPLQYIYQPQLLSSL
jgi:hypothetical protein